MTSTPYLSLWLLVWLGWSGKSMTGAGNVSFECSDWQASERGWQQSPRQHIPFSSVTWLDGLCKHGYVNLWFQHCVLSSTPFFFSSNHSWLRFIFMTSCLMDHAEDGSVVRHKNKAVWEKMFLQKIVFYTIHTYVLAEITKEIGILTNSAITGKLNWEMYVTLHFIRFPICAIIPLCYKGFNQFYLWQFLWWLSFLKGSLKISIKVMCFFSLLLMELLSVSPFHPHHTPVFLSFSRNFSWHSLNTKWPF